MSETSFIVHHASGILLHLRVMPRSSKSGPLGTYGSMLKWGVHAAPVDGKANEAVISSIAAFFDVTKRCVLILKGESSREKTVLVEGVSEAAARRLLEDYGLSIST